ELGLAGLDGGHLVRAVRTVPVGRRLRRRGSDIAGAGGERGPGQAEQRGGEKTATCGEHGGSLSASRDRRAATDGPPAVEIPRSRGNADDSRGGLTHFATRRSTNFLGLGAGAIPPRPPHPGGHRWTTRTPA